MKNIFRIPLLLLFAIAGPAAQAQEDVAMADGMRSEGKIYVVVAIALLIFAGLITYLFSIERKASRLEKRFPEKKS